MEVLAAKTGYEEDMIEESDVESVVLLDKPAKSPRYVSTAKAGSDAELDTAVATGDSGRYEDLSVGDIPERVGGRRGKKRNRQDFALPLRQDFAADCSPRQRVAREEARARRTVMVKGLDKRSKMDPCGPAGDGEPKGRVLRTRIECMLVPNTPANTVYEVLSYCDEMDVASYKIDLQHALISITHWQQAGDTVTLTAESVCTLTRDEAAQAQPVHQSLVELAKAAAEASSELYRSPAGKRSAMQALTAGTAKKARDLTHSPSTPLGFVP